MAKILLRHADVITLDTEGCILRDADVAIEEGHFVALGAAPDGFLPDETVDVHEHILLPGFVNAHTHSPMTLFRGWDDGSLRERRFGEQACMAERSMTAEDVYWGAALAAVEMIRGGTTAFADQFFYMDRVARVVIESGLPRQPGLVRLRPRGGRDWHGSARHRCLCRGVAGRGRRAPAHCAGPLFALRLLASVSRPFGRGRGPAGRGHPDPRRRKPGAGAGLAPAH